MNGIAALLTELARSRPDTLALLDGRQGRRLTYAQLEREVKEAAAWLHGQGFRRNDAILVFVPMSADLYVALLAMFRLGMVALFLDPSAGAEHMAQCCRRWAPAGFLAIPKAHLLRLRCPALRQIPRMIVLGGWAPLATRWLAGKARPGATEETTRLEDPALVTFTSGSTGVPKAAVRSHGFLLAQYRALAPSIRLEPGDVDLATLPVFTLANLAAGIVTVIPDVDLRRPGAVDGATVLRQIERAGVTRVTASPAFFECLIRGATAAGRTLPALRKLYTGGAPVFPRLLRGLRSIAPNADVVAAYGSTEAEPIAHVALDEITPEDEAAMEGGGGLLAGHCVDEIQLRVLPDRWGVPRADLTPDAFAAEVLPPGAMGEIVVAGEHVLRGYLGGIGDEETKFKVGETRWHRTGDAGRLDQQGRLWLLGRCAARIQDARGTLYPFGVECAAMSFAQVERAAAIAHEQRRYLFVQCGGTTPPSFAEALKQAVQWAPIDEVKIVDRLPVDKRHNAKIDYPALRAMLGAG